MKLVRDESFISLNEVRCPLSLFGKLQRSEMESTYRVVRSIAFAKKGAVQWKLDI